VLGFWDSEERDELNNDCMVAGRLVAAFDADEIVERAWSDGHDFEGIEDVQAMWVRARDVSLEVRDARLWELCIEAHLWN
jgi:hypothetical protein